MWVAHIHSTFCFIAFCFSFYCVGLLLFISSPLVEHLGSTKQHLGCFHLGAIRNKAAKNSHVQCWIVLRGYILSFLLGKCLRVKWQVL